MTKMGSQYLMDNPSLLDALCESIHIFNVRIEIDKQDKRHRMVIERIIAKSNKTIWAMVISPYSVEFLCSGILNRSVLAYGDSMQEYYDIVGMVLAHLDFPVEQISNIMANIINRKE